MVLRLIFGLQIYNVIPQATAVVEAYLLAYTNSVYHLQVSNRFGSYMVMIAIACMLFIDQKILGMYSVLTPAITEKRLRYLRIVILGTFVVFTTPYLVSSFEYAIYQTEDLQTIGRFSAAVFGTFAIAVDSSTSFWITKLLYRYSHERNANNREAVVKYDLIYGLNLSLILFDLTALVVYSLGTLFPVYYLPLGHAVSGVIAIHSSAQLKLLLELKQLALLNLSENKELDSTPKPQRLNELVKHTVTLPATVLHDEVYETNT
ncbi:hypothetical protein HDV03_001711 [Kappamyces sp. JEL0829]|nr:hypothetical protein HDV03_001711 [Kappamyces sp. JEL0829]